MVHESLTVWPFPDGLLKQKKREIWKCRLGKTNIKEKKNILATRREYFRNMNVRQHLWKQSRYVRLQFKLNHCSIGVHRFLNFLRYLYEFSPLAYSRHFPSNHDQLFATLEFIRPEIKPAAWPISPSFSLYPASGPRKRILSTYSSTYPWRDGNDLWDVPVEWPESNIVAGIDPSCGERGLK